MKRNIKLLTQHCCEQLLTFSGRTELRSQYNQAQIDSSYLELLKTPTKYFVDDSIIPGHTPKDDCQGSIDLFTQLQDLDRVQANDKRLWVCLTHTIFFDYTRKRWDIGPDSSDESLVRRFHFEGGSIEARMRNSVSRLWWTAKVTYDPNRSDPFELTKLIWERQDIQVALMERSFGTYPNLVQGFLDFYKNNRQLTEDEIRFILRGINSIGGVKLIPLIDQKGILGEIKKVSDFAGIRVNA